MKEKTNIFLRTCVIICIWGTVIYFSLRSCVSCIHKDRQKNEIELRKQFVADSIAHVKDSLEHDPNYQDSLMKVRQEMEKERAEFKSWYDTHTLVIIKEKDDSIKLFHSTTSCLTFGYYSYNMYAYKHDDMDDLFLFKLVTLKEALDKGFSQCEDCEEIESVYGKYENGEIVDFDKVEEIARDYFDMIKPDEYDPDYRPDYDYYER